MTAFSIPFALPGFCIQQVIVTEQEIQVEAAASQSNATCPRCGTRSTAVHSHYQRRLRDVPMLTKTVHLRLTVRRFRCRNPNCSQHFFTERLPDLAPAYARYTTRCTTVLAQIGLALGGEAGSRFGHGLHLPVSADTLLRILRHQRFAVSATPRVLGVDDWAFAKGRRYGTLLVDLEKGVPLDLLPDRTAETLTTWLKAHPGIEIITRDRLNEYAHAVNEACPTAIQVADRWHLLKNLRETVERVLRRLHAQLRSLPASAELLTLTTTARPQRLRPPSANEQASTTANRQQRYRLYRLVHYLLARGVSQRQIARLLHLHRITVRLFAQAETFPERMPQKRRASILGLYLPYLSERWQAGCTNARQLLREVQTRGYTGSYQQVARWAHAQRQLPPSTSREAPIPVVPTFALPTPHSLAWLFLNRREQLSPRETAILSHCCQHPPCHHLYVLAQQFCAMLRLHQPELLDRWLEACADTQLLDLNEFAFALQRDLEAVRNACIYPWSNGPVEGQICRLKLIKRQMYGRAKLDLLRVRVLARSLTVAPN